MVLVFSPELREDGLPAPFGAGYVTRERIPTSPGRLGVVPLVPVTMLVRFLTLLPQELLGRTKSNLLAH